MTETSPSTTATIGASAPGAPAPGVSAPGVSADIIAEASGVPPDDRLRARRPVTAQAAQDSHEALFTPRSEADASRAERHAVALFVTLLHAAPNLAAHHADALRRQPGGAALVEAVQAAAARGAAHGPYGRYPAGPLSTEDQPGPDLAFAANDAATLGPRLAAALAHAHLLVFHPRDARPAHLGRLIDAGWSSTGIVTLSQLVAFLAFQIRVVAGLRVLAQA
ncbi:CMD domain protein [Xanthobacter sp. V4C-4]|uniref:CMD domain protein n=1 Tax=Xanthobacter cornucopiae TaxID=3119924 RepID=UPI00372793CE